MKQFLVIEHDDDRHEDITYVVSGATFADALKNFPQPFDERIEFYLEDVSPHEVFPPTRVREGKVVNLIGYKAPDISAYEIVGQVTDAQAQVNSYVAAELVTGIAKEKKRREK